MVKWIKNNRVPTIQTERKKVDWLYKINVKLTQFMRAPHFDDILLYRFEDECLYLHMELVDQGKESEYWLKQV
jgi:hypothetical protein